MAIVKPFRAIKPKKGLESQIAALPYDVYNRAEARAFVKGRPLSFLNIDRPETYFPEGHDLYAPEVYQKASDRITEMLAAGEFVEDEQTCYYLYEQTMNGRTQTGIVACVSIDDYLNDVVKKHENTREEKEQDRIQHIDVSGMQTGPIFLAYRSDEELTELVNQEKEKPCDFDFVSEDDIRHRGWSISEEEEVGKIGKAFSKMSHLYIADGHHRTASAVKVGLKRRAENPEYTGEEEFNYFLSVLFQEQELMIMDYNRVVRDLNGLQEEEFLLKVSEKFDIEESEKAVSPTRKGEIGMFLGNQWYRLQIKPEYTNSHPVDGLDVSVLQNEVLAPILGIQDPRTDLRIDFSGGIRGLQELERRVRTDCAVAFAMYPTSIRELFEVADAGLLMPPKSTWFEPKLRSGLYLHSLR